MLYVVKTPNFVKKIFSSLTWHIATEEKNIYLTFDDGPTPEITNWVLNELEKYNAKATFFCIGKNILNHPSIFKTILEKGHRIGNHTNNHLNCWKKNTKTYIKNIAQAQNVINLNANQQEKLFRPPYGKLTNSVRKRVLKKGYKIIMWDILSGDFDTKISNEKCLKNVLNNSSNGSIIVFHDSVKASEKLKYVLPKTLKHFSEKGYTFKPV